MKKKKTIREDRKRLSTVEANEMRANRKEIAEKEPGNWKESGAGSSQPAA